jgi:Raf kinase inhibitor-like YbhB/YbcL family protein
MWWRPILLAVIVVLACGPAGASSFTLETSAFLNGGGMPRIDAASARDCGGRNLSPPLHFIGFPSTARSFAVVAFDTDGGYGRGFVHWVAYGIAPTLTSLPPGFGSAASPAFIGGINDAGTLLYSGPCPPHGDPPHHYIFTAYALDLAPAQLKPGLTRAMFLRATVSHTLAQAQITGRFSR